uniref:zinc finger protein 84-like isoform X1 n=2 Tax=Styela clava TaxID=7725 RepID=UPI001939A5F5|nr:zinc finger protein 84-like isoform X1 [Styela clava]
MRKFEDFNINHHVCHLMMSFLVDPSIEDDGVGNQDLITIVVDQRSDSPSHVEDSESSDLSESQPSSENESGNEASSEDESGDECFKCRMKFFRTIDLQRHLRYHAKKTHSNSQDSFSQNCNNFENFKTVESPPLLQISIIAESASVVQTSFEKTDESLEIFQDSPNEESSVFKKNGRNKIEDISSLQDCFVNIKKLTSYEKYFLNLNVALHEESVISEHDINGNAITNQKKSEKSGEKMKSESKQASSLVQKNLRGNHETKNNDGVPIHCVKNLQCYICRKMFTRKDHVKRHLKNVHKSNPKLGTNAKAKTTKNVHLKNVNKSDPKLGINANLKTTKRSKVLAPLFPQKELRENRKKQNIGGFRNTADSGKQCHICHKTFSQKQHVRRHLREVHKLLTLSRKQHVKRHLRAVHKIFCSTCNQGFSRKSDFSRHMNRAHKNDKKFSSDFLCYVCGNEYSTRWNLEKHMGKHLSQIGKEKVIIKNKERNCLKKTNNVVERCSNEEPMTVIQGHAAKECSSVAIESYVIEDFILYGKEPHIQLGNEFIDLTHKESPTISKSGNHVIESNQFSSESSSSIISQYENHQCREIVQLHRARNEYVCKFCDKIFKHKPCLVKHEIMIHSSKPICPDCNIGFTSMKHLEKHFEKYTEKLYLECVKCAEKFLNEKEFQTHLDLNRCWIYFCEMCGDLFRFHELKDHMRSHTGEDSYCCNNLRCSSPVNKVPTRCHNPC